MKAAGVFAGGRGSFMARLTIFTVFALAISSFGQVTVTNSGVATTPGPAILATPVSPPIMFTPIVQLGQAPTQPMQATAPADMLPPVGAQQDQQTASLGAATGSRNTPFNFGVAQFDTASGTGSVGQDINGKSLGDLARERRRPNATNARMYTNSDIDQLNQVGGT